MTTTLHTLDPLRDVRGMDAEDDYHGQDHDFPDGIAIVSVAWTPHAVGVMHDGHTLGMAFRLRAGGWIADLWGESRPRTLTADDGSEAAFATLAEASRALLAAAEVA